MEENCLKLSTPVGKIEKQLQKDADQDIDLTGLCNTKTQPSFFYQFNNEVVVCVVNSASNPEDIYPLASVVRNIYQYICIGTLYEYLFIHIYNT